MNNLKDEIIDILKDVYYNNDQADPFDPNDADRILSLFEKRIDSIKVQYMQYYAVPDLINEIKEMLKS